MKLPRLFQPHSAGEALEHRLIIKAARLVKGIDRNKVVFRCFQGRSYGDNPRAISERLHELRPETDIVWLYMGSCAKEMKAALPDYVRAVNLQARQSLVEMATARVWVDNFTKNKLLKGFPKGRQFYIQTWHGDRPIKKICYDAFPGDYYRLEQDADLVLTGSDFGQKVFRTAFRYDGEYLNDGAPRNDILVRNDPAEAEAVRKKLGIPSGTKLLLYAPTYRDNSDVVPRSAQMDLKRVLDLLEERGEKWLCLYRAHYLSKGFEGEMDPARMVDVSAYESMSELLLIADMLLTDYSSCATDYCLLDRPMFMYMADFEEYLSNRDCYYDPHDTPLPVADDQAELERLIRETDADAARRTCQAIRAYYGIRETGHATDAVCRYIIDRLG